MEDKSVSARQKCTFKWQWQDKSVRLNGKTKVYV